MALLHNVWYFRSVCGAGHRRLILVIVVTHLEAICAAERMICRISEFTWKLKVSESHVCVLRDRIRGDAFTRFRIRNSGCSICYPRLVGKKQGGTMETVNYDAAAKRYFHLTRQGM